MFCFIRETGIWHFSGIWRMKHLQNGYTRKGRKGWTVDRGKKEQLYEKWREFLISADCIKPQPTWKLLGTWQRDLSLQLTGLMAGVWTLLKRDLLSGRREITDIKGKLMDVCERNGCWQPLPYLILVCTLMIWGIYHWLAKWNKFPS